MWQVVFDLFSDVLKTVEVGDYSKETRYNLKSKVNMYTMLTEQAEHILGNCEYFMEIILYITIWFIWTFYV